MNTTLMIISFVVIAILAFFFGRWQGMSSRSKELMEELEKKDEELSELKSNVDEHFSETARLFSNLTDEYKALYQHLAQGANKLSKAPFKMALTASTVDAIEVDENSTEQTDDNTNVEIDDNVNEQVSDEQVNDNKVEPSLDENIETEENTSESEAAIQDEAPQTEISDPDLEQVDAEDKESQNKIVEGKDSQIEQPLDAVAEDDLPKEQSEEVAKQPLDYATDSDESFDETSDKQ